MKHELLEEVWRIRDEISTECGHDLKRLAARLRAEERKYADRLAHPEPKPPGPKMRSRKRTVAKLV